MWGCFFDEANEIVFDLGEAVVMIFDSGVESDAEIAYGGSASSEFFEKGHRTFGVIVFEPFEKGRP